jgi:hypothetical protein
MRRVQAPSRGCVELSIDHLGVVEPEEADRSRASVGADDCPEHRLDLDIGLRPGAADELT